MKKKIGIVTWKGWGNFGTSLQSYALHKKLENLGYNAYFIDYFPSNLNLRYSLRFVIKRIYSILGIDIFRNRRRLNYKCFRKFNQEYYNTVYIYNNQVYQQLLNSTDVFVTGSDQIWNAWHEYNPFYFLNFVIKQKKVAYASSMGTSNFPDKYVLEISKHLSQFQHIGVREKSSVNYLNTLLNRNDIINVLDPTFLLTPIEWSELSQETCCSISLKSPYIFCYLIGQNENYIKQLEIIQTKTRIERIIIIPAAENPDFVVHNAEVANNIGPKEFIWLLMNAAYVCTDSFHATALSINFSKDFVEFLRFTDKDPKSQNSRIYDLLEHYALSYKLYSSTDDRWLKTVDYSKVNQILSADREASLKYLINSIEL